MKSHSYLKPLLLLSALSILSGCSLKSQDSSYSISGSVVDSVTKEDSAFADGDTKDVTEEDGDATITLSGSSGTISDTTRGSSGSTVTITSKGTYRVQGSSTNVTIMINETNKSGNVYLVLDNVTMTHDSFACIYVKSADKVILQLVGENSITSTYSGATDDSKTIDGAIHARDDLTINGEGSLEVKSPSVHGIVCKNDLKITAGDITVNAGKKGIDVGDSLRIGGGDINVTSGHDGVQIENDEGNSYLYMEGGSLTITASYDGIDIGTTATTFTGYAKFVDGQLNITSGGGANKSQSSNSTKGIKCQGDIYVGDVEMEISSSDDALHSDASISITAGDLKLASSDDGVHADSTLSISGGEIEVTKSYEGLEAYIFDMSGGNVSVTASDDGINAAGGSDSSSTETNPWGNRGRASSSTGTLKISGGNLFVSAQGDGLDSNGSIYISGGTTIVEGPTGNGNGALDKGDGSGAVASITGGTVLALGSTGMAVNFDSGSQCSGLVSLSGSSGTTVTVNDSSSFSHTVSKSFACVVYSSPYMSKGSSYQISAGNSSATMNFSSSYYYSNVSGGQGGPGGGGPGGRW